ncbi:protein FAM221B [Sorex fumeus]|uniref:protein FAM221B n=1 Tax=Sorex fumeus TaxID=62283 RepID=UPI0024AE47E6|nr:protein FAM221B [Sorex fumeus]
MDAKQQSSSLVPSAQNSEEPINSKPILEPSTYDYPTEALISEFFMELATLEIPKISSPTSEIPLETHSSEHYMRPISSQEYSEDQVLESPLSSPSETLSAEYEKVQYVPHTKEETVIYENPALKMETSIFQTSFGRSTKEKHLDFQVHPDLVSVSSFDDLQELTQTSGFPESPTKQAEMADMAKALHRQKFHSQGKHLFHWAENTSLNAIQSGLYIGWRCPHYLWDCFQIGNESKCFCGHLLKEHKILSDISVPCSVSQCRCLMFCFIPSRPEEVGEFWLRRRAFFDPKAWRALCRCKHSHEEHAATGGHPCRVKGCCCVCFESNFLCAACDRRWEEHETFFETEDTRRRGGRPHGEK